MSPASELVDSIKGLFDNPVLSDLRIVSRQKTYHAHKVIIYPRTDFGNESGEQDNEIFKDGVLDLQDDDAQAVDSLIQYLYTLDYRSLAVDEVVDQPTSPEPVENHANTNGIDHQEPEAPFRAPPEAPAEVSAELLAPLDSLDDIPSMPMTSKKKNKKSKKRKPSTVAIQEIPLSPEPRDEELPTEAARADTPPSELSHTADSAIDVYGSASEVLLGEPTTPLALEAVPPPAPAQESIKLHARVYALSVKYGVSGLRNLALGKFARGAEQGWDTDEFLGAAREVYGPEQTRDNRELRDVVLSTLFYHQDFLDKEEAVNMMKGLDIGMELLVHIRNIRKNDTTFVW